MVREVGKDHLYIVRFTSTHKTSSGARLLKRAWTLLHSRVTQGEGGWAAVGLLTAPQFSVCSLEFTPVKERIHI